MSPPALARGFSVLFTDDLLAPGGRLPEGLLAAQGDTTCVALFNHGYVYTTNRSRGTCWAPYKRALPARVLVETAITFLGGTEPRIAGLRIGQQALSMPVGGVDFVISDDGRYALFSERGSTPVVLTAWQHSDALLSGRDVTNRIAIEANGSRVDLFINQKHVGAQPVSDSLGSYSAFIIARTLQSSEPLSVRFGYLRASALP